VDRAGQLFSSCSERGFRAIKILYVVCGAREREGEGWGGGRRVRAGCVLNLRNNIVRDNARELGGGCGFV
jgi:hypothetical protein